MKQIQIKIDGMSCQGCVSSIKNALVKLDVSDSQIDLDSKTATITFDENKQQSEAIACAIGELGFDVEIMP